jgi:hypothetical protein
MDNPPRRVTSHIKSPTGHWATRRGAFGLLNERQSVEGNDRPGPILFDCGNRILLKRGRGPSLSYAVLLLLNNVNAANHHAWRLDTQSVPFRRAPMTPVDGNAWDWAGFVYLPLDSRITRRSAVGFSGPSAWLSISSHATRATNDSRDKSACVCKQRSGNTT